MNNESYKAHGLLIARMHTADGQPETPCDVCAIKDRVAHAEAKLAIAENEYAAATAHTKEAIVLAYILGRGKKGASESEVDRAYAWVLKKVRRATQGEFEYLGLSTHVCDVFAGRHRPTSKCAVRAVRKSAERIDMERNRRDLANERWADKQPPLEPEHIPGCRSGNLTREAILDGAEVCPMSCACWCHGGIA